MERIRNITELKEVTAGVYVWAWTSWASEYTIWYWDGEDGLGEQAPTDMADHRRASREGIANDMFPMFVIPSPPDRPEIIDEIRKELI